MRGIAPPSLASLARRSRVPDERIRAAVENWAPRFTSQGVDPNDFARTTAPLERWAEWLPAWCALGERHAQLAREAQELGRTRTAGEAWVRAALAYHFAKFVWMVDLERHRDASERAVAALRRPAGSRRPPLALLLPGLDSTKEEFFSWENVFLVRGMATFSLDGPGQGEGGYDLHIRPDYEAAVAAALDALAG